MKPQPRSVIENELIRYELLPTGILTARYKRHPVFTLSMVEAIVETRLEHYGSFCRPVLIYNEGVVEMQKEARRYIVSHPTALMGVSAGAILVQSSGTSFIMNYILTLDRPLIPARTFTRETSAMLWLSKFL